MSQPKNSQASQEVSKSEAAVKSEEPKGHPKNSQKDNSGQVKKAEDSKGQEKKKGKRPIRLQNLKLIEINRRHTESRGRARLLKEISFAILGHRRFKRIEVTCTLNLFFNALKICSLIHRRVAGMFMIVELQQVEYLELENEEDTKGTQKKHSLFRITLTKFPSQKDKASYGFHQAFKAEEIKNPFKLPQGKKRTMNRRGKGQRRDRNDRRGYRRDDKFRNQRREDRREDRYQKRDDRFERRNERDRYDRRNERDRYERKNERETRRREDRYERPNERRGRYDDRYNEDRYENRKAKRDKDEKYDRPRRYREDERESYKKEGNRNYAQKDTNRGYIFVKDRKDNFDKKEKEGQYERGSYKSRGNGRLAQHHYDPSHIKRQRQDEERRDRKPPRRKYDEISDEDW